jgi:hypothetical protein
MRAQSFPGTSTSPSSCPSGRGGFFAARTADAKIAVAMRDVRLKNGGADGLVSTAGDNTLFLTQGIFIP